MAEEGKKRKSPYHLDLVPGEGARRPEWNSIFYSNVPIGIDFAHTDMLEKVIIITVKGFENKKEEVEEVKE